MKSEKVCGKQGKPSESRDREGESESRERESVERTDSTCFSVSNRSERKERINVQER